MRGVTAAAILAFLLFVPAASAWQQNLIYGTQRDDVIKGTSFHDEVWAGAGEDLVEGAGGQDVIHGNSGDDILKGGASHDQLFGGPGTDWMFGAGGHDGFFTRNDNASPNFLEGGNGWDDFKTINPGEDANGNLIYGRDTINCGLGYDNVWGDRADVPKYGSWAKAGCENVTIDGEVIRSSPAPPPQ